MDETLKLKQLLHWSLGNGAPLRDDADSHAALKCAFWNSSVVAVSPLVACHNHRHQLHLGASSSLRPHCSLAIAEQCRQCRREWHCAAAEKRFERLHGENGFRFTIKHNRAAVVW